MDLPIRYMARVAVRTPRIACGLVKGFLRKKLLAPMEYHLRNDGRASTIKEIDLKITNLCNLRCRMCAQWGQSGYNFDRPAEALREMVPAEYYKKVVDDCARFDPLYYIWGGEPMLYPDILEVLGHIKSRGHLCALITNGTLIAEHAAELVRMELDSIMISLDGPREVHDEVRGRAGTFDELSAAIEAIRRERRARNKATPILVLLMTITTTNCTAVVQTLEVADRLGADFVGIYFSWFTNRQIGERHTRFMQQHFCVTPTAWNGFLLDATEMDVEQLIEEIRRVRRLRLRFPVLFVPDLSESRIRRYYSDPAHTFGYQRCYTPWYLVGIGPNGDVGACRDHPDYVCGNIREESLPEIFNGERFRHFRRVLKENKLLPICGRCCGLMGF
jgi:radical SAM protein with 4Fe4S-binding SPASM domain